MEKTKAKLNGKRILIWGYGREGKATEKLLKEHCQPASVEIYEGGRDGIRDEDYDYIFVSPGIKFEEDAPGWNNRKFTSETELFLEEYGDRTVGITGTKGKSTTTAMLAHVLQACLTGKKVFLMGNIGLPCFSFLPEMDEDSLAVFELSCHQCQRLQADPHIAVFLDLFEDHLDRYHTMAHYFDAKQGITKHQTGEDYLYLGAEVPPLETSAKRIVIGPEDVTDDFDLRVPGEHNQYDAEFVFRIARDRFGCKEGDIREALKSFHGLPHRLQYVGTVNGVDYYDDSISTIPEAAINAAEAVKNTRTLLIGGMDRGIDYDLLYTYIRQHPDYYFICAYASGKRIADAVGTVPNLTYVDDLAAQVALAQKITKPGEAVILSPAAASYGYFRNFEDRGDRFQALVLGAQV